MAITIRAMKEADLAIASQIFRLAFGSFIGLPDPQDFAKTMNYMNRWYLDPSAAFVAEENGQIIGSNIAANWGSFGGNVVLKCPHVMKLRDKPNPDKKSRVCLTRFVAHATIPCIG
ncbi:MAG: hypothetical protein SNJ57_20865 [Cyanobacteriota bacterium]